MKAIATRALLSACVAFALSVSSSPVNAQTWTFTGSMANGRWSHTATLLNSGMVLMTGGQGNGPVFLSSAELYNPATGTFTLTGSLNVARYDHTGTLLSNGMVLIVGGNNGYGGVLASAELYNPATGAFTLTGSLNTARFYHTATLLSNGTVLIVGGLDSGGNPTANAELYNPATGAFTLTGSLNTARLFQTATLLSNGMALIAGGFDTGNYTGVPPLASAELYNPTSGAFTYTENLNTGRAGHSATLLNSGMALIAGGFDSNGNCLASAELYNPTTGVFTLTGTLNTGRVSNTETLLGDGMVLIAGGFGGSYYGENVLASAELYNPASGAFAYTGSLNTGRDSYTATLLNNGTVLAAGGDPGNGSSLASAELYAPTPSFQAPYGFFANSGACSSSGGGSPFSLSGGVTIDGYNSANGGTYLSTKMNSLGIIGSNGSVVLSGGSEVGGNIYVQNPAVNGKCPTSNVFASGGATYGGVAGISAYSPPVPSIPAAGTANVSLSGSASQTLAAGSYNNISLSGGSSLTLTAPGTFNINCLKLSGGSTLTISPSTQQVVLNVTGTSCSGNAPIDFSGGSMSNSSGIAANFLINYAGTQSIKLTGGPDTYIAVNAPNAAISLSGGTDLFGAIIGNTINVSGGVQLHFDTALQ